MSLIRNLVITPENNYSSEDRKGWPKVFLGGSIEEGEASQWQQKVIEESSGCVFYNPRIGKWKSDPNSDYLKNQILWELNGLEQADIILIYLDENTKSPISLLELGIWLKDPRKQPLVYCPSEFYRKANVEVTTRFYGGRCFNTYESWMHEFKKKIEYARIKPN